MRNDLQTNKSTYNQWLIFVDTNVPDTALGDLSGKISIGVRIGRGTAA
jgi:hypothetical protein